jgi:mannose/cellobiose epimerase-like protein (N-acyl-D-glucosamine 2-epimerase family)
MAGSFLADLWLALLRASDGDVERAQAAFNWLRNECPRGRGVEPGHRGWCYLPTDKAATLERHRQMEDMADFGFKPGEIAAVLHYAEGTVKNYLSARRKR